MHSALINLRNNSQKRKRSDRVWRRDMNKLARQTGSAYVKYNKIVVPAKKPNLLNKLCWERCRRNCSEKFSKEQRQALFSAFYSLDQNGKNYMLLNCMQRRDVVHHRKKVQKKKQNSFTYSIKLPENDERIVVCKTAISSLFQIPMTKIDRIKQKHASGKMFPLCDRRGKHKGRKNKTPDDVINELLNHIHSFPLESLPLQYCSSNFNHPIENSSLPTLSMKQMHDKYIEHCESKDLPKEYFVKYRCYVYYFSMKFNPTNGAQ